MMMKEKREFTIKEIYLRLNKKVGLTTVYRMTDKLVSEGLLKKTVTKSGCTYFHYVEKCTNENHFYLRCDKCGNIIHVDCDHAKELASHILKEHDFQLNQNTILLNGICKKCLGDLK